MKTNQRCADIGITRIRPRFREMDLPEGAVDVTARPRTHYGLS
jgi:hypothetical protein